MKGWLDSQVALVTGGAGGIGRAVVERFLAEGAAGVVAVDRASAALVDLRKRWPEKVQIIDGDVREYSTHERAVNAALQTFGALDVVVANAGIYDFRRPLSSYTPMLLDDTMNELFAVNLRGYLYSALSSLDALRASRGSIIFTASVASHYAGGGGILYTAVKHAIAGVVRQLAYELAPDVRVNGVGPGGTISELSGTSSLGHQDRTINADGTLGDRIASRVLLGFAQQPEDHTGLYVLLASRENASAVTGEIFMSDGGVGSRSV
ncbi:SDR family NAD(P)-dependent oxidoreductase [Paraburkholderia caribensis]|uniref:SDR family NAD(P)-dependent oxidoreductase n=1 Tax=Paraburkholderia caribensis TaxID=75105 RepID=UPI001CB3E20D|nr:SDR family NAD(P)-dependent oxidoreductase [Paraburkholderia caribensis]CAG9263008.1 2,3-dihydroxy-2,3-dihydrophenylpropionate dehydrogenase [Paraburkholderia caribensis]